ncbi:hypothetical protein IID19_02235 [Patescibacteria group bacterium]|nr:hypothetical protein [Patescibacteria group bacterium]
MKKISGFTHWLVAILISIIAVGLVGAAWLYEENKNEFTNAATSNIATTINTNVEPPTINSNQTKIFTTINQWSYYPNYYGIRQVIETDQEYWLATSGGVLKINKENFNVGVLTEAQGLPGNTVTSFDLVENKNELWVGVQGGIGKFNSNNLKLIKAYTTNDGLASSSNIELRRDPYTDILWAGTFRGLSKYEEVADSWTSYTQAHGVAFAGVEEVQFDQENIWIFVSPNAKTPGGILKMSKADGGWTHYPESIHFPLEENSILLASNSSTVIAASRPYDWISVDESREADVYVYNHADDIWIKLEAVYDLIGENDYIRKIEATYNGVFTFTVIQRDNNATVIVVYDPSTENATTQQPEPTFLEQHKSKMAFPSRMAIQYIIGNTIFLESLHTIDSNTHEFDSRMRDTVFAYENEVKPSDFHLLDCNKHTAAVDDQYLLSGSIGHDTNLYGLYAYRNNDNVVEKLLDKEEVIELFDGTGWTDKVQWCEDDVLYLLSEEGMKKKDLNTGQEVLISKNYHEANVKYFTHGTKTYYRTIDNEIGIFDKQTEQFSYISLPDVDIINVGGNIVDNVSLILKDVIEDDYWFLPPSKTGPAAIHSVFVFHADSEVWETIDISDLLASRSEYLQNLTHSRDTILLISSDSLYIKKHNTNSFTTLSDTANDLMMSSTGSIFPVMGGTWFSGGAGVWYSPLTLIDLSN